MKDKQRSKNKTTNLESTTVLKEKKILFSYDLYLTCVTNLPYSTCEIMSNKIHKGEYHSQRLIFGQQWQSVYPNSRPCLILADVDLPYNFSDAINFSDGQKINQAVGCDIISGNNIGRVKTIVKIAHEGDINKARSCPQKNQLIATKTSFGYVNLFDYQYFSSCPEDNISCMPQMKLEGHGRVDGYGLVWNHNYQGILLSCSYDGLICMWDINTKGGARNVVQPHSTFRCHTGYAEDIAWFPLHDRLFGSVGNDGLLIIWDTREGKGVMAQKLQNKEAVSLALSKNDETSIAIGFSTGSISILDLRCLSSTLLSFRGHDKAVRQLCFSPLNGNFLASGGDDGIVNIWDLSCSKINKKNNTNIPSEVLFSNGNFMSPINDLSWSPTDPGVIASVTNTENCIWQPAEQYFFKQELR